VRRLRADFKIEDVTIHDMRTAISTWLGDQGVRPDVIDRILNHKPKSVTRRHYNFALMDKFVRAAMQMWADHVHRIAGETSPTIGKSLLARARIRPVPRRIRRKELVVPAEQNKSKPYRRAICLRWRPCHCDIARRRSERCRRHYQ
jgi:hypothetical protein